MATRATAWRNPSTAERISGEWEAMLTAKGIVRFAPRSFASAIARLTASSAPEMTI